jgi:hypothetical protein
MGYQRSEVLSRVADNNGQYPDYTILPNTENCWYLEAKAWKDTLSDSHAQQSLNYANSNGRHWVVLTNGKQWRLYDNRIQGLPAAKQVVEVSINDPGTLSVFLEALSKPAVLTNGLDEFVSAFHLQHTLPKQLIIAQSPVVQSILGILRKDPRFRHVTDEQISDFFANILTGVGATTPTTSTAVLPTRMKTPTNHPKAMKQPTVEFDLQQMPLHLASVEKQRPCRVTLPDSTTLSVASWADVAKEVVSYLAEASKLPALPHSGRSRGKKYFLNTSLNHQHAPMRGFRAVTRNDKTIYIDTNRSSSGIVRSLNELLITVQVPAQDIRIGF